MNFDDLVNNYLNEDLDARTPEIDEARGRPKSVAKTFQPAPKAFEVGYADDSVEGRLIQFASDKPATMEELITFLRANFDEYHAVSACKEKIRQMVMDDILDIAPEAALDDDEYNPGKENPALDPAGDEEPDLMSHIGGAYQDYRRSTDLTDY